MTTRQPRAARARRLTSALASIAAAAGALTVAAQEPVGIMGINGSWERYPNIASGLGSDSARVAPAGACDPFPIRPSNRSTSANGVRAQLVRPSSSNRVCRNPTAALPASRKACRG